LVTTIDQPQKTNITPPPTDPSKNALPPLGEKIFLDRYAVKDMKKTTLAEGDLVIVCTDLKTGQREIGTATRIVGDQVTVKLRDGETIARAIEHIDSRWKRTPPR